MPYVIFTANEQEIDRRELKGALVIGRASECDICIRDIMMSRTHCRIEQQGEFWVITDLSSRNGTFINHERVEHHLLRQGDVLRMGRTRMKYCAGRFEPAAKADQRPARVRPVDPNESFAGTVVGFELLEPGEAEYDESMPIPQPRPREPRGYEKDDVHALVNDIASSAWNSSDRKTSVAIATQKAARQSRVGSRKVRVKSRVSFDLQADRSWEDLDELNGEKKKRFRKLTKTEQRLATALLTMALVMVTSAIWLALHARSPANVSASEPATAVKALQAAMANDVEPGDSPSDAPAVPRDQWDQWRGAESEETNDIDAPNEPPAISKTEAAARALLYAVF